MSEDKAMPWAAFIGGVTLLAAFALLLVACGPDEAPEVEVPSWAHVAPEQIAEAAKHGEPVAFENDLGMRFVLIPAGTFLMGSPEDEEGRRVDETQHEVTISQPFYMQTTEVTEEQYAKHGPWQSPVEPIRPGYPPTRIRFGEAEAFANWLTKSGRVYVLPTEAQWEFACRAGSSTRFSTGEDLTLVHARFGESGTVPVASYTPNRWGLYDMHGNVAEWCCDWYAAYGSEPVTDPIGPSDGKERVLRGGWYTAPKKWVRSAARSTDSPGDPYGTFRCGFRLVSPLPEQGEGGR